jgi:hypothetical protein
VGGYSGRKILYDPSSGRALVKRTHSEEEQALLEAEQGYMDSLARGPIEGGLEIF